MAPWTCRAAPWALAVAVLAGCAPARLHLRPTPPNADLPALDAAAEHFYGASDSAGLKVAVEEARAAGAGSARYHALASRLAMYDGRSADQVEHLLAAVQDPADDAVLLYLYWLDNDTNWTFPQRRQVKRVLDAIAREHPNAEARALAAFDVSLVHHVDGDWSARDAAVALVPGVLRFAVVGSWDNDQGKGFDQVLPPEDGVDLTARYPGALLEIGWRPEAPVNYRGELDLGELMTPGKWAVAYATADAEAGADGRYGLRIASSVPFKVWVDGKYRFGVSQVDTYRFDQFVIPLQLGKGKHRVLVKSAQRQGGWNLYARLTSEGAAPEDSGRRPEAADLIAARVRTPVGTLRRAFELAEWARVSVGVSEAVRSADAFFAAAPKSIEARWQLTAALWSNGEQGRTVDLLGALDRDAGAELPFLRSKQARQQRQLGMLRKAREALASVVRQRPGSFDAWTELASAYEAEEWLEDRCFTLEEQDRRFPETLAVRYDLAACYQAQGYDEKAVDVYRGLRRHMPGSAMTLGKLNAYALSHGVPALAAETADALVRAYPEDVSLHLGQAETRRRLGDAAGAEASLHAALARNPDAPAAWKMLGRLAYERGDRARATERWTGALERNPNDETLANRLDYLAPEPGPWLSDVPGDEQLDGVLGSRNKLSPRPGADKAYLLDHEVTRLRADGSSAGVVTMVLHALNEQGRDEMTRQSLLYGRARVLRAYALDPKGRRSEASSIRGTQVWFRGLSVGSTTVLQFRFDRPPVGYLSRHLARDFWFQGARDQRTLSQWVLYLPAGAKLHEHRQGAHQREERRIGDERRITWTMREVPPIIPEKDMPTLREVAAGVQISTVPEWDTYLKWEEALLDDAMRESPELGVLADQLGAGASPQARVRRVQAFVMQEIRYQQDYENHMAGVRPHPAPMVLERRYGDCKDKAVLFVTLAKRLGIAAHFALVRTRGQGPVREGVPMQQFNHAIVFVPRQRGIDEERFYDPTADALDIDSLRDDDPGTRAWVYDPVERKHQWRDIPFQPPRANSQHSELSLTLAADGSAEGTLTRSLRGRAGSAARRFSRNPEQFRQAMQLLADAYLPGSTAAAEQVLEAKDLDSPARFRFELKAATAARREGAELRLRVPIDWSPRSVTALAKRQFALVLGVPEELTWQVAIDIPEAMRVSKLPQAVRASSACLDFERTVQQQGTRVLVHQRLTSLCERIGAAEYDAFRSETEKLGRITDEELVMVDRGPVAKER
ncbi:MAG: transglutaminase domain-containing protein [Myxococcaceae bacterium]